MFLSELSKLPQKLVFWDVFKLIMVATGTTVVIGSDGDIVKDVMAVRHCFIVFHVKPLSFCRTP